MALVSIPTSADIYIEVNGTKVAAAQSYRVKSSRQSRYVEAFGSSEPVGTVGGRVQHWIELSRVCLCRAQGVDFYELSGFNLVIVQPDCKIIYSGCEWSDRQVGRLRFCAGLPVKGWTGRAENSCGRWQTMPLCCVFR